METIEIIILDAKTFNIKDYSFSNDYTILFDSLVKASSTINIGNKNINAKSNDIVITRGFTKQYIGIIDSLTNQNNIMSIKLSYYSNLLNIKSMQGSQANVNLGQAIKNMVSEELINSDDALQNIDYLEIENKATITGSIYVSGSEASSLGTQSKKSISILNLISSILKGYELVIDYLPIYYENGKIKGIKMVIMDVNKQITIKESEKFISEVNIVDGRIGMTNKLIYYPSDSNILYKEKLTYYLLNDGNITQDSSDQNRIIPIIPESSTYSDKDIYYDAGETLLGKVKEKFANTTYNHYIQFTLNENNSIKLNELSLGDRIKFIDKEKNIFNTIITKLEYTSKNNSVKVTLGFNRVSLTDKLSLREENV